MPSTTFFAGFCALLSLLTAAGCASDPYGFSPRYVPGDGEEPLLRRAVDPPYEDVRRDPSSFQAELVGWFGVVEAVSAPDSSGRVRVALERHVHQDRHLCSDQFDSSCRVTIAQRASGPFSAWLMLHPDDREGRNRLSAGSLVKVYGHALPDYDERGGPILRGEYYRHWPHGTYVTTHSSVSMRR